MNQEQVAMSGEVQDPVLSGLAGLETKIDIMSGLNIQLNESNKMLKQISEKLWIVNVPNNIITGTKVSTPAGNMMPPVWNNVVATGTKK